MVNMVNIYMRKYGKYLEKNRGGYMSKHGKYMRKHGDYMNGQDVYIREQV